MLDLKSARHWARELHMSAACPGAVCVDATMGNGADTQALCQLVGDSGRVYAFDVQQRALDQTRARLADAHLLSRAQLILSGHEQMAAWIKESVDLAVFNLGWLPGAEDKGVTTRLETTRLALEAALSLLKRGGLITICAYPGHEEGARELAGLTDWAARLDPARHQAMARHYLNQSPAAPALIAIERIR